MSAATTHPPAGCRAADRRPCLVVDAPPSEDLAAQCRALGVELRRADAPGDLPPAAILGGAGSSEAVSAGLAAPYHGFIELGAEGVLGAGLRCFETARAGGLTLSLRTSTVYRLETLELVAAAVRAIFPGLSRNTADLLEISLAEALSNAVIHGNLGIPNHLRTTADGFAQFQRLMLKRLNDPALASRRIEINVQGRGPDAISVAVSDQGDGFDLNAKLAHIAATTAKNGRGLGLIRKVTQALHTEDGGRTLVMSFAD
jgi:anti-sigma regulatory factor (Ser/Thr protein kinase)